MAKIRELECTNKVLPQVIDRGKLCSVFDSEFSSLFYTCTGLNLTKVAHDHQVQEKKYVVDELKLKNSSDTWHGMFVYIICVLYVTNRIWKYVYVVHVCYVIFGESWNKGSL